ncbi:hypothetical protein [Vibrio sp. RE86]
MERYGQLYFISKRRRYRR